MHQYVRNISSLHNPSFQQIRKIADSSLSKFSKNERTQYWKDLNQGVDLLESHELMCQYIYSYGNMHQAKINAALKAISNPKDIFSNELTIIDWGCGQGLATICYFDFLNQNNITNNTQQVILIEPSKLALNRAKVHVDAYLKNEHKIKEVNKYLDDVNNFDIITNQEITLHFFSNILDVPQIDLKKLAQLVGENIQGEHYFFCVSPLIEGEKSHRLDIFYDYFNQINSPIIFSNAESSENHLKLLAEDAHLKDITRRYTQKLKVFFKFERQTSYYFPIEYYPPVQFHASYKLDFVKNQNVSLLEEINELSDFETYVPFDLGASIYDDIHPIYAVLNNIITRGLPTRASPFIEKKFTEFGNQLLKTENGQIEFNIEKVEIKNKFLTHSLILIARLQKIIIEALITQRLDINSQRWNILVKENDFPCSAIAFADLEQMFNNLTSLSVDYDNMKLPQIHLDIIGSNVYLNSSLHLGIKPFDSPNNQLMAKEYDLVIDIAIDKTTTNLALSFSEFKCKNLCYFVIRSATSTRNTRRIYTSDTIDYKPIVSKDSLGNYIENNSNLEYLKYFVQLLFRKENFRPGQLPILDRALQNRSVIGLLPTGGGKSLTYQLAAMLQPGVTLIVDPLRSLMKDQYDGLINAGIDTCTYINSTLSSRDKEIREKQMESSQMQFVFLSPERLCIFKFRERLKTMRDMHVYFAYGVIDEVHCVSEWGHDFRFSYLHLGRNLYNYVLPKNKKKRLTLFGLTATASFDVLADVERELSGNGAFPLDSESIVRYENTNRLELQYRVEKIEPAMAPSSHWDIYRAKNSNVSDFIFKVPSLINELQSKQSIDYIKERFILREGLTESNDNSVIQEILAAKLEANFTNNWLDTNIPYNQGGIVFCPHRQGSLGVKDSNVNIGVASSIINNLGCKDIGTFLGGDEMSDQDKFINNELAIMVATKAFGMGIDKSNVRFTINLNYSSSLESFIQEAGRAGRDKKMALATILYSDYLNVDKDVIMYFHNNTFKGAIHEKKVLYELLSKKSIDCFVSDDETIEELETHSVYGFLDLLLGSDVHQNIISYISYVDNINYDGFDKYDYVAKAIYRMSCIGIVDDFTQDYSKTRFRIVTRRKEDGDYYKSLQQFLMRYYSIERAQQEILRVKDYKGENEIHKCLGYLAEFIYEKIEVKRRRAISDIQSFCIQGIDHTKDWKEINEDLKDFIYYYFNSKYAKEDYVTEFGEDFSLTKDSDFGKKSTFDILFKYLRVIDENVYGTSGSPKDNVKHLQGAVRLIRRSLTDNNPTLFLLNSFCLAYLGTNNNETLNLESENSYKEGYLYYYQYTLDKSVFYNSIQEFKRKLVEIHMDKKINNILDEWETECELEIHNHWLEKFTKSFTNKK